MNAIDPSNNYGGGKVKFFTGGTGGGGQTIRLLPIMFGSNNMTTDFGGAMLPLNSTQYVGDGLAISNPYANDINATSYLPTLDNDYFYYITNGQITENGSEDVSVELELYIDGIIIETIPIDLNSGNGYSTNFNFNKPNFLNEYPVNRFGIRVNQTIGTLSRFIVSTTSVFLSVFDSNEFKSEFFTSSNTNEIKIGVNFRYFFGFGGQTNATDSAIRTLCSSVVSSYTSFELIRFYIMFSEPISGGENDLEIDLFINGLVYTTFLQQTNEIVPYIPYEFNIDPYIMSSEDTMFVSIRNTIDGNLSIFEIGIYGYEIVD